MNGTILVTYATRYGSTREAAAVVAGRLTRLGHPTRVAPVDEAGSPDGACAVVLGTALYLGAPLPDAVRWLDRWRPKLEGLPVAVFALGPLRASDGTDDSRAQLDAALAKRSWLRPAAVGVFTGRFDPSRLRLTDRLIAALPASPLHGVPALDERDARQVERWAETLPLRLAVPV